MRKGSITKGSVMAKVMDFAHEKYLDSKKVDPETQKPLSDGFFCAPELSIELGSPISNVTNAVIKGVRNGGLFRTGLKSTCRFAGRSHYHYCINRKPNKIQDLPKPKPKPIQSHEYHEVKLEDHEPTPRPMMRPISPAPEPQHAMKSMPKMPDSPPGTIVINIENVNIYMGQNGHKKEESQVKEA